MIKNVKKDNVVIELYRKFNLIARKIIVLSVKKNERTFDDFITAELQQPTLIIETWDGYFIGWAVAGRIRTKTQKAFYRALALRLKKTFLTRCSKGIRVENSSLWALQYALDNGFCVINNDAVYEMKALAGACVSLTTDEEKSGKLSTDTSLREELHVYAGTYEKSDDALFDFIRFKAYDYMRIQKQNNVDIRLEDLKNYCLTIAELGYEVIGGKGISTAHAKAKNIAQWVYNYYRTGRKPRKTKSQEELKMTRIERSKANAKLKYDKVHKKIINIVTGMFASEYKKKDGSWNISKIAKDANVDRKTVYKHLRDEKLI